MKKTELITAWSSRLLILFFSTVVLWWIGLQLLGSKERTENYLFSALYSFMPLVWGGLGVLKSNRWGGLSSNMGRAILFLSLGQVGWGIGNLIFAYYNLILQIPVPYPSVADLGFFMLYPLSVIGAVQLFRVVGATTALQKRGGRLILIAAPVLLFGLSYYLLFVVARGGVLDFASHDVLKLILDIAYPVGDSVVIGIAATIYTLSRGYLGGRYRSPILLILVGFLLTYIADFLFSYTTTLNVYYVGKWVDIFYPSAFLCIGLGLMALDPSSLTVKHKTNSEKAST